ncbi:MAG: hypothetical protein GDA56_16880 [Hormoscilla sp. GM7CHS1pb]|nr:hypothetical protein [Hormoscilla sp. GM7CHS1pb]
MRRLHDPEENQKLEYHLKELSKLLYADTPPEALKDFESRELAVREHLFRTVGPVLGNFFLLMGSRLNPDASGKSKPA